MLGFLGIWPRVLTYFWGPTVYTKSVYMARTYVIHRTRTPSKALLTWHCENTSPNTHMSLHSAMSSSGRQMAFIYQVLVIVFQLNVNRTTCSLLFFIHHLLRCLLGCRLLYWHLAGLLCVWSIRPAPQQPSTNGRHRYLYKCIPHCVLDRPWNTTRRRT